MELRDSGSLSVSALELPMANATSLMTKICSFRLKKKRPRGRENDVWMGTNLRRRKR